MPIEQFDRQEFEQALHRTGFAVSAPWFVSGEYVYRLAVGAYASIVVRSSIGEDGLAMATGQNSIRMWLELLDEQQAWGIQEGADSYTTREPGWQTRLYEKLLPLVELGQQIKQLVPVCCARRTRVFFVKKEGANFGRPFSKCRKCEKFTWLDEEVQVLPPTPPRLAEMFSESAPQPPAQREDSGFLAGLRAQQGQAEPVPKQEASLSDEQAAAVYADPQVGVGLMATAGSGKTFTLVKRYAYLVREQGFDPSRIVVVAYNKTMGDLLATRIIKECPQAVKGSSWIGTIHAFCFRLLKAMDPTKNWGVAEGYEQKRYINQVIEEVWANEKELPTWTEVLQVIGMAKARGLAAGEDLRFYLQVEPGHADKLAAARDKYDALLRANNQVTFGDMLFMVDHKLRTDAQWVQTVRSMFDYVIVDESQDVTGQALRILVALARDHGRIFMVGDQDQLLYRFLGADPTMLTEGAKQAFPQLLQLKLQTNYRSGTAIVAACQKLIRFNYTDEGGPYKQELMKECRAREGVPEAAVHFFGLYDNPYAEAAAVADLVAELLARGATTPGGLMATSRTKGYLAYLEGALTRRRVPFVNVSGGSFWLQKHIQDVLAYVRLTYWPQQKAAFERCHNIASNYMTVPWKGSKSYQKYCPTRFLGKVFLKECDGDFAQRRRALKSEQGYKWKAGVADLEEMLGELEQAKERGLVEVIKSVLSYSYMQYLRYEEGLKGDENSAKTEDFEVMLDLAQSLQTVDRFFEYVDTCIENAQRAQQQDRSGMMVIGTIYAFKGDERDLVFNIGWGEGETQRSDGSTMCFGLLPHTFSMEEPPQDGIFHLSSKGRVEDERCVAFVAASRAKQEVYFSYSSNYRNLKLGPSRFLGELGLFDEQASDVEVQDGDLVEVLDQVQNLLDDEYKAGH